MKERKERNRKVESEIEGNRCLYLEMEKKREGEKERERKGER